MSSGSTGDGSSATGQRTICLSGQETELKAIGPPRREGDDRTDARFPVTSGGGRRRRRSPPQTRRRGRRRRSCHGPTEVRQSSGSDGDDNSRQGNDATQNYAMKLRRI
mmetsp:Transcript_33679/g.80558  ORF Transcript_33679/g.80558 Transcript_33679/m.80558 type:complete len:108 (-) Transcript_33679:72-395(-)